MTESDASRWKGLGAQASKRLTECKAQLESSPDFSQACRDLNAKLQDLLEQNDPGAASSDTPRRPDERDSAASVRLLSQLCTAPPSDMSAMDESMHALPATPQTNAIALVGQLNRLMSSGDHQAALNLYLQVNLPSLAWNMPSHPADTQRSLHHVSSSSSGFSYSSAATNAPSLGSTGTMLQAIQRKLQIWAAKSLAELHPDAGVALVHHDLLSSAWHQIPSPSSVAWFRLHLRAEDHAASRDLIAAVYHLSASREAAWRSLLRVLWHGLAVQANAEDSSRPGGRGGSVQRGGSQEVDLKAALASTAGPDQKPHKWVPHSYVRRYEELVQQQAKLMKKAIEKHGGASHRKTSAFPRARSEVAADAAQCGVTAAFVAEIHDYMHAMLPRTFLRMVGQKLLYHATRQLPHLSCLPERVPASVVSTLYGRPFAEAMRQALEAVLARDVHDTAPFIQATKGHVVRAYRTLHGTRDGAVEAEASVGGRGASLSFHPSGPSKSANFVRAETSKSSVAATTYSVMGFLGQTTVRGVEAGAAMSAAQATLGSTLTLLLSILQDYAHFYKGLAEISYQVASPSASGTSPDDDAHAVLVAMRPQLGRFIVDSLVSAAKSLLDDTSVDGLRSMDLSPDFWPPPEYMRVVFQGADSVVASVSRRSPICGPEVDVERPVCVDQVSYQVLSLVVSNLLRLPAYPTILQSYVSLGVLECLLLLMDRLASLCAPCRNVPPGAANAPLLFLSAACCVRRRLDAFRRALETPLHDAVYATLLARYSNASLQAEDLVGNLQRHIASQYISTTSQLVFWGIDAVDWGSFRAFLKNPAHASAHMCVWRLTLLRLLHYAAHYCSQQATQTLLAQVLEETLQRASDRLLSLSPSPQRLPRHVADVMHTVATAFILCQVYTVRGGAFLVPTQRTDEDEPCVTLSGMRSLQSFDFDTLQPAASDALSHANSGGLDASTGAGAGGGGAGSRVQKVLQVPLATAAGAAAVAQRLLRRAALLECSAAALCAAARPLAAAGALHSTPSPNSSQSSSPSPPPADGVATAPGFAVPSAVPPTASRPTSSTGTRSGSSGAVPPVAAGPSSSSGAAAAAAAAAVRGSLSGADNPVASRPTSSTSGRGGPSGAVPPVDVPRPTSSSAAAHGGPSSANGLIAGAASGGGATNAVAASAFVDQVLATLTGEPSTSAVVPEHRLPPRTPLATLAPVQQPQQQQQTPGHRASSPRPPAGPSPDLLQGAAAPAPPRQPQAVAGPVAEGREWRQHHSLATTRALTTAEQSVQQGEPLTSAAAAAAAAAAGRHMTPVEHQHHHRHVDEDHTSQHSSHYACPMTGGCVEQLPQHHGASCPSGFGHSGAMGPLFSPPEPASHGGGDLRGSCMKTGGPMCEGLEEPCSSSSTSRSSTSRSSSSYINGSHNRTMAGCWFPNNSRCLGALDTASAGPVAEGKDRCSSSTMVEGKEPCSSSAMAEGSSSTIAGLSSPVLGLGAVDQAAAGPLAEGKEPRTSAADRGSAGPVAEGKEPRKSLVASQVPVGWSTANAGGVDSVLKNAMDNQPAVAARRRGSVVFALPSEASGSRPSRSPSLVLAERGGGGGSKTAGGGGGAAQKAGGREDSAEAVAHVAVWAWLPIEIRGAFKASVAPLSSMFHPLERLDSGNVLEAQALQWRLALAHLVATAPPQDVLDALAKRHELHACVKGLPYSEDELAARRQVRAVARELQLAMEGQDA